MRTSIRKKVVSKQLTRIACPECETLFDSDETDEEWVECEACHDWYHISCAGLESLSKEELNAFIFNCDLCIQFM